MYRDPPYAGVVMIKNVPVDLGEGAELLQKITQENTNIRVTPRWPQWFDGQWASEAKKNTNWKIEVESPIEAERLIKGKHITLGGVQVEVEPVGIGYMKKPSFANVLAGGTAAMMMTSRKVVPYMTGKRLNTGKRIT